MQNIILVIQEHLGFGVSGGENLPAALAEFQNLIRDEVFIEGDPVGVAFRLVLSDIVSVGVLEASLVTILHEGEDCNIFPFTQDKPESPACQLDIELHLVAKDST